MLLLYLLLASGDLFRTSWSSSCPAARPDNAVAGEVVHEAEAVVLRYLVLNAVINGGQAVVIALVMWWLRMPSPMFWGVFTFVLEFVPYLGATSWWRCWRSSPSRRSRPSAAGRCRRRVPLITTLQNNVVSPYAYGSRLKLNPVAVLVGVLFWWFVWGIPGAFLAVPIVATMKIIADRTRGLEAVGEFLGE